ncbi:MAG TPA: hypothetical protein VM238_18355 [Phycisphaerae bacterium]|nr:hypothetical protein [Phycisphaerae bacterium]
MYEDTHKAYTQVTQLLPKDARDVLGKLPDNQRSAAYGIIQELVNSKLDLADQLTQLRANLSGANPDESTPQEPVIPTTEPTAGTESPAFKAMLDEAKREFQTKLEALQQDFTHQRLTDAERYLASRMKSAGFPNEGHLAEALKVRAQMRLYDISQGKPPTQDQTDSLFAGEEDSNLIGFAKGLGWAPPQTKSQAALAGWRSEDVAEMGAGVEGSPESGQQAFNPATEDEGLERALSELRT